MNTFAFWLRGEKKRCFDALTSSSFLFLSLSSLLTTSLPNPEHFFFTNICVFFAASSLCTHKRGEGKKDEKCLSISFRAKDILKTYGWVNMWELVVREKVPWGRMTGEMTGEYWGTKHSIFQRQYIFISLQAGLRRLLYPISTFLCSTSLEMIFHPRTIRKCQWNLSSQRNTVLNNVR